MMLPMSRSEVFKILADIFCQSDIKMKMLLSDIMMRESTGEPYDIDFWCEYTESLVGYLRIVNPPEDCVDGEYCFVYHSSISQKDGNIAIDPFGNIRVYGDDVNSFIYTAIKDNANKLAGYAKKLTQTYQHQVADTIVSVVKTYCETLMNKHANLFTQLDISTDSVYECCTEFLIRAMNEPERNCQFDVVKHIYEHNIIDNDIWVRFINPKGWLWTPIVIKPSIGDIVINTEQCVFTDIFGAKELVRLARLISEQTGFAISVGDGSSTRDQNVAKYIKSLLQKHEVLDAVKQVSKEKDEEIGCEDVFNAVIEWLSGIRRVDNITRDKLHQVYSADVINIDNLKVTERLEVSYAAYMRYIRIYLGKEHIITIDDIGDPTAVYITNYHQKIDLVLNKYLVACLAERLKEVFKLDKLRAYVASKCGKYTELTHNGPWFFNDDGKTAFCCDPSCAISALPSTNKLKLEIVLDGMSDEQKKEIDDLLNNLSEITNPKSKLENAKEPDTPTELVTKYSIEDEIHGNLNDFQKRVYKSIYVAIFCALVESKKFVHKAFEFEKYFTHYVSTDRDLEGYHVFFRYDRIHNGLPGFEIVFYDESTVYLRYVDYLSSQTLQHPLAMLKTDGDMKIYLSSLKYNRRYDPSILASVAAKLVHVEVLR